MALSSVLEFLWNLPTIHRLTMAILFPAKPFSPSVCLCFHCSLDVMPQKRLRFAFVLTLLSGRSREWGIAVWRSRAPCCATFADFCQEMTKLFDRSAQGDEAAAQLSQLSQKMCSVTDYAIQFQTLAANAVNPLLRGATWSPRYPMPRVLCQLRLSPCNWVGSGSRRSRTRRV